jgi:hypothetical protein
VSAFSEWESFYVIVGSSAGALIGLQFVVLTLLAERPRPRLAEGSAAFTSPTIVHFAAVLLLSAVISAPWRGHTVVAWLWGVISLAGLGYLVIVMRRMRTQHVYKPVFEDWLTHAILPFIAYALIGAAALLADGHPHAVNFGVAAASLVLLFTSIHNAWDTASYHVLSPRGSSEPRHRG